MLKIIGLLFVVGAVYYFVADDSNFNSKVENGVSETKQIVNEVKSSINRVKEKLNY